MISLRWHRMTRHQRRMARRLRGRHGLRQELRLGRTDGLFSKTDRG